MTNLQRKSRPARVDGKSQAITQFVPWQNLLILFSLLMASGCKEKESTSWNLQLNSDSSSGIAPDRLNDDELLEGEQKIFEFTLPRKMRPTTRFARSGKAEGPVALGALRRYVAKRIDSGEVELLPQHTRFKNASLKAAPEKRYLIEIKLHQGLAQLTLRNQSSRTDASKMTESEVLKAAGFRADGSLDPAQQLE